jgi:hypothetical protein
MYKIFFLGLIGLIGVSCSDPNNLGLEVQPPSDNIIISDITSFKWQKSQTKSEDSLRTDEALNLILGEINDAEFGVNRGGFYTQILLKENNIDLGDNPIVDSVVMSYTYSNHYGDLEEFSNLEIIELSEPIYKDSIYYSDFEINHTNFPVNLVESFHLNTDDEAPSLKIKLNNYLGQKIIDLGNEELVDSETFLQNFYGLGILAQANNTMLYLNPQGSNTVLKVYYHNNGSSADTLSLDFELGGDAARINIFNEKNENTIIDDSLRIYIQSMAGYKVKISISNIDSIKSLLDKKIINKVIMSFDIEDNSQEEYEAHEKLFLVRVNEDGENIYLLDYTVEGETYFGGRLENNKYHFSITRYFSQLLYNDSYTKDLYLLPAGAAVNSNRTMLNKNIQLQINYSEL